MAIAQAKPTDIDDRRWGQQVEKGKQLAASFDRGGAAFELGDLALAVEPIGGEGTHTGGLDRLAKYAEAIGVSFNTLRTYRRVARAWPADTRVSAGEIDPADLLTKARERRGRERGTIARNVEREITRIYRARKVA